MVIITVILIIHTIIILTCDDSSNIYIPIYNSFVNNWLNDSTILFDGNIEGINTGHNDFNFNIISFKAASISSIILFINQ